MSLLFIKAVLTHKNEKYFADKKIKVKTFQRSRDCTSFAIRPLNDICNVTSQVSQNEHDNAIRQKST